MDIVFIVTGLVVGFVIGFLFVNGQKKVLAEKCGTLSSEVSSLKETNDLLAKSVSSLTEEKNKAQIEAELARNNIEALDKSHKQAVENMKEAFDETVKNMKDKMNTITAELLDKRKNEYDEQAKKNIHSVIDPLNDTIGKLQAAMEGYSKEQNLFKGSMEVHMKEIVTQAVNASKSAEALTNALKHDTKVQGDYGEAILDEILKAQGFTEGIHYELQYVEKDDSGREIKGDDGKGLRPDVVFHLDTVRDVIIDSKMNLTDFINFANSSTPEERQINLEKHVKSIESQVKLLSQKNYFKYHKKTNTRMDYVIMFVPISAAWWEALRYKPSLWREAMESNVFIADEQTLFAALRIIKLTWTQIAQAKSQKEIFDLVNEMIDRVGLFRKNYDDIGKALSNAQKSFDKGSHQLAPNGKSILNTTKKLIDLGARDSKTNPVSPFLDVENIEQLPEPEMLPEDDDTI